jgi:hypothetical protein
MFYDGPERPADIFDDFLNLLEFPIIETSASFLELLKIYPSSDIFAGNRLVILPLFYRENKILRRAYFSTVSVLQYSASLLKVIVNETLVSNCYSISSSNHHNDGPLI